MKNAQMVSLLVRASSLVEYEMLQQKNVVMGLNPIVVKISVMIF